MKNSMFSMFLIGAFAFFANAQTNQPRNVRDFFNLLPQKYFTLEGCADNPTKANCNRARREYIESFLEVEDTANGYWKSGCDGAQSCLVMALFKRPNGTYIVALQTSLEMEMTNYFLEYRGGKWFDLTRQVIPGYSKNNLYLLPQNGTTIDVIAKNPAENIGKWKKLYDLVWKSGKFSVKK